MASEPEFPFENRWKVHRKPGARRIAIRHPMWDKPMYLTPADAEDLMKQIAEALGVDGPDVAMKERCQSATQVGGLTLQCLAWESEHVFGTHYAFTTGDAKVTWTDTDTR